MTFNVIQLNNFLFACFFNKAWSPRDNERICHGKSWCPAWIFIGICFVFGTSLPMSLRAEATSAEPNERLYGWKCGFYTSQRSQREQWPILTWARYPLYPNHNLVSNNDVCIYIYICIQYIPVGSMGLVYLPTFTNNFNGVFMPVYHSKKRKIHRLEGWMACKINPDVQANSEHGRSRHPTLQIHMLLM